MEIHIRDYQPTDDKHIPQIFRDSHNSLRKSMGGMHPDSEIDKVVKKTDEALIAPLKVEKVIMVAEVKGSGELVGTAVISNHFLNRLYGVTYSDFHYVKESFQRGRMGVNVGSLLRQASINRAREMGFRKIYGNSTPEAVNFHKKFGAVFIPKYNKFNGMVVTEYYEIVLRKSILNGLRLERSFWSLIFTEKLLGTLWALGPIGTLKLAHALLIPLKTSDKNTVLKKADVIQKR